MSGVLEVLNDKPVSSKGERPSSTNSCRLCAPLGASLAFRGVDGMVPLLHGSQGCATYIRRFMISHYREPLDIASSSFDEAATIFGGESNLKLAVKNVVRQYEPTAVGVATTCLAETMGEDVERYARAFAKAEPDAVPVVTVSTPSYAACHSEGYRFAVRALVERFAAAEGEAPDLNLLWPMLSPADLRHLKELCAAFGLRGVYLPDYSDTLDGGAWDEYETIPPGGTTLREIASMGLARASIELGLVAAPQRLSAPVLTERFGVPGHALPIPVGIDATDRFVNLLAELAGRPVPYLVAADRARLVDAYVDGHKYLHGKRVAIVAEEELALALTSFCLEVGLVPALVASGGGKGRLARALQALPGGDEREVLEDVDFAITEGALERGSFDFVIGSSKAYATCRRRELPLLRVGFPIHDRFGGQRLLHVGYRGTQWLFDACVNLVLQMKQDRSPVGYTYL